jgi:hypothetical protein
MRPPLHELCRPGRIRPIASTRARSYHLSNFLRSCSNRGVKLRFWLPAAQTLTMALILWSAWSRNVLDQRFEARTEGEVKHLAFDRLPIAIDWAQGLNLPAVTVVSPVEFSLRNREAWRNWTVMLFGLWIAGLLCWYMVGRVADDLIRWRRQHVLSPKRGSDLIFAFLALPASILVAAAYPLGNQEAVVTATWGPVWITLSVIAFVFRVFQFIKLRRRPAGQAAS